MTILEKIEVLEKSKNIFAFKQDKFGLDVIIQYNDGSFQVEEVKIDCINELYTDAYISFVSVDKAFNYAKDRGFTLNFILCD